MMAVFHPAAPVKKPVVRAARAEERVLRCSCGALEAGMAAAPDDVAPTRVPKPVRLKKRRPLTIDDIETAIAAGRD